MNRIKINDYFFLDEYVQKEMIDKWGARAIWWLRPELLAIDLFLRKRFDLPIIINDWFTGGQRNQSGLRYPEHDIGAGDSLHRFGCASDKRWEGKDEEWYKTVRQDIEDNFTTLYKPLGLTTIEADTPDWLHTDCRNTGIEGLYIVLPQ